MVARLKQTTRLLYGDTIENIHDRIAQRPRVLHVIEATLGGTLRYVKDAIHVLPAGHFRIALAYSTLRADPGLEQVLEEAKIKGWELFPLEMVRSVAPAHDLRSIFRLHKILRSFQPQVVHCHSSKAGAIARIAVRGFSPRPRVVYTPHALAIDIGMQYLFFEKLLAPLTDCFGAVSESERKQFEQHGLLSRAKGLVIDPLIDTDYYFPQDRAAARAAIGIAPDAQVVVGVGRLTGQKDPLMFIDIIRQVASNAKALKAIWIGDGELRTTVEAEVQRTSLQDVVLLAGWKKDVRTWLAASDLLLSTSKYESYGYMVAEALAMERPVVATAVTGTSDIMCGELNEFLYSAGNAEAASKVVLALLNNPTRALSIGQSARESIQARFSAMQMSKALSDCYLDLHGDYRARAMRSGGTGL